MRVEGAVCGIRRTASHWPGANCACFHRGGGPGGREEEAGDDGETKHQQGDREADLWTDRAPSAR